MEENGISQNLKERSIPTMKRLGYVILAGICSVCFSVAIAQEEKVSDVQEGSSKAEGMQVMKQKDLRSEPVKRVVALGESTTWGYSVTSKEKCWVNRTVRLLEEFQGQPIELINQGIGANMLTPKNPEYAQSAKPSAIERLSGDLIALKPDLVLLSYGLNDSRGGISLKVFTEEYQKLIDRIKSETKALIVVLNVYYMHESAYQWEVLNHSNYSVTRQFNAAIADLAKENGLILADVWSVEEGVDWIIDQDLCHPNDLGHCLIANRVFEAIARNCSFVTGTLPKQSSFGSFVKKYGNGPDRPSSTKKTKDFTPDPEKER
jgi:lysophospholipase L1-like esterase